MFLMTEIRMKWKGAILAGVFLLLGVFFIETTGSMTGDSATFDEGHHLAAGFCYLQTEPTLFNPDHPPLADLISALPLLLVKPTPKLPPLSLYSDSRGELLGLLFYVSQKLLYHSSPGADTLLFWARIPGIILAATLGLMVFLWSRKLYGVFSGLAALLLFVFSPNILAHCRVVTNDIGSVFFMFLSIYFVWRALKTFQKKYFLFAGLASGCALASKYTAIIILPIYFILGGISVIWRRPAAEERMSPARQAYVTFSGLFCAGLVAFLVVALVYKVSYFHLYFKGLFEIMRSYAGESPSFLLGDYSETGWWHYFVVTFLIKTPLAMLLLLALAIIFGRRIPVTSLWDEMFLILPAVIYFLSVSASRFNIGHRHILLVYPLLFIFVSKVIHLRVKHRAIVRIFLVVIFLGYALSSISVYPHYIAYFNELVGGPKNGHKYLSDSNIDWGQDLKRLKVFIEENDIKGVYLSYFGEADPNYYGINYQWILPDGPLPYREFPSPPEKRYLAISVKCLQGVSFPDHTVYRWLEKYQPIARIGYSIFIYDLTGKIDAYLKMASIYFLTGQYNLAEKELQDVLALDPNHSVARKNLRILKDMDRSRIWEK